MLGIELTPEDVGDTLNRELTPDELENVAGGFWDGVLIVVKNVLAILGVPIPVR